MAFGFDKALKMLKAGDKVRRFSWPEGQYVVMRAGYPEGIALNASTARSLELPEGTVKKFDPYLMIHQANGHIGYWMPTPADLLADDWQWVSNANQCAPHGPVDTTLTIGLPASGEIQGPGVI